MNVLRVYVGWFKNTLWCFGISGCYGSLIWAFWECRVGVLGVWVRYFRSVRSFVESRVGVSRVQGGCFGSVQDG